MYCQVIYTSSHVILWLFWLNINAIFAHTPRNTLLEVFGVSGGYRYNSQLQEAEIYLLCGSYNNGLIKTNNHRFRVGLLNYIWVNDMDGPAVSCHFNVSKTRLSDLHHLQDSRTLSQQHNNEAYGPSFYPDRCSTGIRKRRSCETQLLLTIQDLASTIDVMGQTDVILLDFSKAFDKVPHLRLLSKIRYYGIQNNLNWWISSFLEGRNQQVLLDGSSFTSSPVESGVPQGSVLGPIFTFSM